MSWYQFYETLEVYRLAFDASMEILDATRNFPPEGIMMVSENIRRSARLVCHHISEAVRQKTSQTLFLHNLANAKMEAEDTMTWIKQAVAKEYISMESGARLYSSYHSVVAKLSGLLTHPAPHVLEKAA
jgi:four helix bundle protein